ncbi:MAG: ubiquinol-cytochrome c reductase iron-sulfur subunit, partial [Prochlorothrix sp.]
MKRRDFLSWVGVGTFATSLPMVLAACSSSEPTAEAPAGEAQSVVGQAIDKAEGAATAMADTGYVTVGTVAELEAAGFLAIADPEKVIVIRDPDNADGVVALSRVCTHKQCDVDWKPEDGYFECPCHDAEFSTAGAVLEGPATQPLAPYEAKIEGENV